MKSKLFFFLTAALLAGCATYEDPPEAVSKSFYKDIPKKDQTLLPSGTTILTLDDAQNLAVTNNPGFRTKYFAIAQARARYYQSFSTYFPTLNAGATIGQNFSQMYHAKASNPNDASSVPKYDYNNWSVQPSLSGQLLLFDSLQREMNLLAARAQYRQSEALEDDARRLLLRSVAYAYNNVMLAAAQMRIAQADMDYSADLLKDTQLKFEAGAVPLSDVLNFKIRYNNGESSLINAEYSYNTNKYVLAGLLGLTEGTIPSSVKFPTMPTEDNDVLADVAVYLDTALANRPDLKAYRHSLEAAKYSFWSSIAAFGPSFTANYALTYTQEHTMYNGDYNWSQDRGIGGFSYGITGQWNLFAGGATYFAARQAQSQMIQADFALAEQWISVITDVRTAYDNYITSIKQTKLYQKTYDLTKQTRDLVEEEYKAGSAELTRMNEAQRDLVTAESNLVSSVVQMANAKAQLDAAINMR